MIKVAFVVSRYHESALGGAELLTRWFAQRLAAGGHEVDVFTTCALDGRTALNVLPAGETAETGVLVRRYPADTPDPHVRSLLESSVAFDPQLPLGDQERWLRAGLASRALEADLTRRAEQYDAVIGLPYLSATTYFAREAASDRYFTLPCLHPEPFASRKFTGEVMRRSRGLIFNSEPERQLAEAYFGSGLPPSGVVGVGFDAPPAAEPELFRRRYGVEGPFGLCVGRLDRGKNVDLLIENFLRYKERFGGELQLILIGDGDAVPEPSANVRRLEIDWAYRDSMFAACSLLFQPSVMESFSIVMMQAWLAGVPVVVHGGSTVSHYHCLRSNGGLWFRNYPEFEVILERLTIEPELGRALGEQGRRYVLKEYNWPAVLQRLERTLASALTDGAGT